MNQLSVESFMDKRGEKNVGKILKLFAFNIYKILYSSIYDNLKIIFKDIP